VLWGCIYQSQKQYSQYTIGKTLVNVREQYLCPPSIKVIWVWEHKRNILGRIY